MGVLSGGRGGGMWRGECPIGGAPLPPAPTAESLSVCVCRPGTAGVGGAEWPHPDGLTWARRYAMPRISGITFRAAIFLAVAGGR